MSETATFRFAGRLQAIWFVRDVAVAGVTFERRGNLVDVTACDVDSLGRAVLAWHHYDHAEYRLTTPRGGRFATLEEATDAASEYFRRTGSLVGIERVTR